ncbi:hypothetical protein ASG40_17540 [Methylobacterium sp. Leaf399]|uniref:hypothetical protein n=1 Tax=unclassified Methylobacterium TaxID=2615210 RepID=UPI0006F66CEB|nr:MULTISPECIES: hypothetical protein [unclassified Methylobacterium]KQP61009.1 hypothetical protein ASF39_15125 [Methylobacterium sp. Leaf108]KQT17190.1 hypothetical protein ASG40_17540 [Methylobacterium sp. Leaf399]KQT77724.1 hypothetical protein ASG59_10295 [Methylobacterium sp. Leaf466]
MYPSAQTPSDTAQGKRRSTASNLGRDGFRPVALPALAAAVQASAAVKPAVRKDGCAVIAARLLHEDAPLV